MNVRWSVMGLLLLTLCAAPASAFAQESAAAEKAALPAAQEGSTATQEDTTTPKAATPKAKEQTMDEMLVETERQVERQGKVTIKAEGLPAEVNVITKDDIEKMPFTRYTDMFRMVPGARVTNYGRGDVGDSISFRGFTNGHSTQVAYFIDGVPINMVQSSHGRGGMADIGWLIPEMVERIEVIKGPVSALYGDFALAGVINIITKKSDKSPSLAGYGGTYDTFRGVGVLSDSTWNPTPFLVWEGYTRDGYRDNSDYQRGQFFNKLTMPVLDGDLSLRFHYAARRWGDPSPLFVSDVKAGQSRRDTVDTTCRGGVENTDVVLNYSPKGGEEGFYGTLYFSHANYSRSTTYLPSPQYRYDDRRNDYGWKLMYNYQPFEQFSVIGGNDLRYTEVHYTTMYTKNLNTIISIDGAYDIKQLDTGFFIQAQYKPFKFLKFEGGLRYDYFNIDIYNRVNPLNSGIAKPTAFSPKIGVVITPYKDINIYANRAQGFRSPGAVEMSPNKKKTDFNLHVATVETYDVGVNALLYERLYLSFDYYNTRMKDEVLQNNTTGLYENIGNTKRTGFDTEAKIFLTKELTIYGSFGDVRGRIKNPQKVGEYYITGLSRDVSTVGFEFLKSWGEETRKSWGKENRVGVNFYYLRYSRATLTADGTKISPQYDQFLSKLSYGWRNWTASVDIIFTPREYSTESMGWNATYNSYTFWPQPRWDVLAGLKYQFY